jgi:hypothetical protein
VDGDIQDGMMMMIITMVVIMALEVNTLLTTIGVQLLNQKQKQKTSGFMIKNSTMFQR